MASAVVSLDPNSVGGGGQEQANATGRDGDAAPNVQKQLAADSEEAIAKAKALEAEAKALEAEEEEQQQEDDVEGEGAEQTHHALPKTEVQRKHVPKKIINRQGSASRTINSPARANQSANQSADEAILKQLVTLGKDTNGKVTTLGTRLAGVEATVGAVKQEQEDLATRVAKLEAKQPTPSLASMPTVSATKAASSSAGSAAKLRAKGKETLDDVQKMKKLQLQITTQGSLVVHARLAHALRKNNPKVDALIGVMEAQVEANEALAPDTVGAARTEAKLALTTVIAATKQQGEHPELCADVEKHMKDWVPTAQLRRMDLVAGPLANAVNSLFKLPTLRTMTHGYAYESLLQAALVQAASTEVTLGDDLLDDDEYMKEVRSSFAPAPAVAPVPTVTKKKHEALEKKTQEAMDRTAELEAEIAELRAGNAKVTKENSELQKSKTKVQADLTKSNTELAKTKTDLSNAKDSLSAAVAAQNPAPGQK